MLLMMTFGNFNDQLITGATYDRVNCKACVMTLVPLNVSLMLLLLRFFYL